MPRYPKPSVRRMVDAIRELTALGSDELSEVIGTVTFDAESILRRIVTRAVERGVELQRSAWLLDNDDANTPLRPPPMSDAPSQGSTEPITRKTRMPPKP